MKDKIKQILQEYFGYVSFKKGQEKIIDKILQGHDVLGIMPTGSGKSICFQVPALAFEGTTIVISPLISLMKDQVDTLNEMGIKAAFINSSLNLQKLQDVTKNARRGVYKLLYIAPERLDNEYFGELLSDIDISLIAVDEAHCVSQWGHDFRPSYVRISSMIESLPKRPAVAAFTATATPEVKKDIVALLKLDDPYILVTGFDRENLYFEVDKPSDKFKFILDYVKKNDGSSGIIYCSTRKTVESICEKLNRQGISATRYHAGLSDKERIANQEAFIYDKIPVIVATNAFGMGIDKSNIRYVIHCNMPKTMENYYQEAGRAGRDGEKADCILLYSGADIITNKFLIENSGGNTDKANEYKKLQEIIDYCNTDSCLRKFILEYFGELDVKDECNNCGNCINNIERTNITIEAQKILSCIKRMGERFGSSAVTDVLRGSSGKRIKAMNFDELSTYGIMKDYSKDTIKEIISFLIAEGYIDVRGDKYPVLALNALAYEWLKSGEELFIKRLIAKEPSKAELKEFYEMKIDKVLFEKLRQLRRELAEEQQVPPFVVFSDATLKDMCRRLPTNEEKMLEVSGVGKFKLEKYCSRFITVIDDYVRENNIIPPTDIIEKNKRKQKGELRKNTRLITYELYTAGKTVEDICEKRGLTRETIEGHLLDCLEQGLSLEYEFIPEGMEQQIIETIDIYGTEKLKPIKEALPLEVSYNAIRFVIWKHKK